MMKSSEATIKAPFFYSFAPSIASKKQPLYSFLFVLIIAFTFFFSQTASAASTDQKVYDNYGLFTEDEITSLEEDLVSYSDSAQADIIVITEDNLDGKTKTEYINEFYDNTGVGYDKEFGDAVIMLINMDPNNRSVEIRGYGNTEYSMNNDNIEYVLDNITPLLKNKEYYNAVNTYSNDVSTLINDYKLASENINNDTINNDLTLNNDGTITNNGTTNVQSDYSTTNQDLSNGTSTNTADNIFFNTWFQLALALVIGAVAVGIMAFQSGGVITVNNRTYLDENTSGIIGKRDDYVRTTVTRVKKQSDNNNGSGGSSVSNSGHSSSGGSRSF